ncbi:Uncharacterised protein [Brucella melitensis]|nr:Uncharacterised protein [Brucella melitensis]
MVCALADAGQHGVEIDAKIKPAQGFLGNSLEIGIEIVCIRRLPLSSAARHGPSSTGMTMMLRANMASI